MPSQDNPKLLQQLKSGFKRTIRCDLPIKDDIKIHENIKKVATGQGNDYTTGFLIDYSYFKDYNRMAAIDLCKQQALDANRKQYNKVTLRKKCPYSELFWSVFSRIPTEYGNLLHESPNSVQMLENTDQKYSQYGHFSHSLILLLI